MTTSNHTHEPTAEFRAHLEWQLGSALRRESRFTAPIDTGKPRLRAVLMVLVALAVGGIAVAASERVQDARKRDTLLEAARSEESLVRLRLDLARADLQDAMGRFEVGAGGRETLLDAQRQVRELETVLRRIQLDLQEIQATSAAPRTELHAPLVGERDFVRERLQLELDAAQHVLKTAEQEAAEARKRLEIGLGPRAALLGADAQVAEARARMQQLRSSLELRQRLLRGEIKAEEVATVTRRLELTLRRERVEREMGIARARVGELRRQVEVGLTTQLELKRAEVELLEREIELQGIRRELEALRTPPR